MGSEALQVTAFEIILHSGDARAVIHQAFAAMREQAFATAEEQLIEANEKILQAHKSQTQLLKEYANGTKIEMEIIMVHAQDHLMTTMTLLEVAQEMKFLYQHRYAE
ncbi:PTS cellobiose transporter subunit IIA [Enterococcus sp. CSURQ0835]|uniref:PTS cellobiose transporter subunit IIA n=1 Tax=Enterococcus sp. CSURQ0835 TaxID=2681394 RepID=UPI0013586B8E|nr:PTS cellobiose transporter subunit IIA [Enterococcus sp. CSURQ0835]